MKILFSTALIILLFSAAFFAQEAKGPKEDLIVAGSGWGNVRVDAKREEVEKILGKGEGEEGHKALEGVYFRQYLEKGIQVSYTHKENKVEAIFFYNKARRYENMATAPVKTDRQIDWKSTYEDVKKAYGEPKEDYSGEVGRRVVFEGIDFRFENNVMVRIGIPGN